MESTKVPLDVIPESKAARWAWRVSLIPLLGIPLFILLAFLALYKIGKGRTGFWLLRRGVDRSAARTRYRAKGQFGPPPTGIRPVKSVTDLSAIQRVPPPVDKRN